MANTRKTGVVDSYAAIKAAQHAASMRPQSAPVPPAGDEPHDLQKLGAHITRTAVPVRQLIECYECGYKFQLHGRAASTNCSKCRVMLDLSDHVIDKKWNGTIKTAGIVRITATGIAEWGEIVANEIILEGKIEAGRVRAMKKLEIRAGARFSENNIQAPDLHIAPGATIAFLDPAEYRDVEIAGTLCANLRATGSVTVRSGGLFQGNLHAEHLVVEDGAGLHATVSIRQDK
jgi:cytoskeletal protein CcmA (bactofilin family)